MIGRVERRLLWRFGPSLLFMVLSMGCDRPRERTGGGHVGSTTTAMPSLPDSPPTKTTKQKGLPETVKGAENQSEENKYSELTKLWGLGELSDLGPAAPVTAVKEGALFVTRNNQLLLAPREGKEGFLPVQAPKEAFAPYGRGPSVSETHAYWISEEGRLLRSSLRTGQVESLFEQARSGTRTSVITTAGRDVVAFIAEMEQQSLSYVWASKGSVKPELLQISPDGAGGTSVAIVPGTPFPKVITLAGRTSMSPLHVRRVRVTEKRLTPEEDRIVWIGPGSHVLTEIFAIDQKYDEAVAFLPTAKNFSDFGLAQLPIESDLGEISAPRWQIYENGLDPAPVASTHMCRGDYLLYARPTEKRPRSPQELHIVKIEGSVVGDGDIIARSRAFNDISLAPIDHGAVVTWTADKRTWAMVLSCPGRKR